MPNQAEGLFRLFLTVVLPEPFGPANIRNRGAGLSMASNLRAGRDFLAGGDRLQHNDTGSINAAQLALLDRDARPSGQDGSPSGCRQSLDGQFWYVCVFSIVLDHWHGLSLVLLPPNYTSRILPVSLGLASSLPRQTTPPTD